MIALQSQSVSKPGLLLRVPLFVLLVFLPGCATTIAGDWHMVEAVPSRQVFALDDVHFGNDGHYAAKYTVEGRSSAAQGTYDFTGIALKLRPEAGGQRRYQATLIGQRLELVDGNRKVVLARGKRGS